MKFEADPIRCRVNARMKTCGLSNFGFFAMLEEGADMKLFPVLLGYLSFREREQYMDCPYSIPWEFIAPHERQAQINHGNQTLERLANRGGLSPDELVAVLEDREWRSMNMRDAVDRLKQIIG